ncbi:MAG: bifunctional folylpolyglutamate synthase/dihydrofolate synthase [Bacteroidales bacterium]|nr:bifunctional folylpolyglutamate synthase/dihydrofolate synthase [Bacteroidales bacterium]MCM1415818.1 bifunctional folylpolyglutamate synthase/dihydrofolate synthase [bacterium]MCM1423605.1 bifunctional folylpolyglutamate synthase/dihydrofolate synthase [bacterium]
MNYREAMNYIEELKFLGSVMGLETMRQLCARLGDPQESLQFVHIAGTNGKGSTLAYVSTVMQTAGYRVGRYLSPTVRDYRERFQVDGSKITQSGLCRYLEPVKEAAEAMAAEGLAHPTLFEVETAVAFLFFLDKACDLVVLETGLGGALDATNVVNNTLAAVFSSISMDHMEILGDTLEEIALVKAGIIKNKCYVISARQTPEVMKVLRQSALLKKGKFLTADAARAKQIRYGLTKQSFSYDRYKNLEISMTGQFQIENAVLAVETVMALTRCGFKVPEEKLRQGMLAARWQGRFDVIAKRPFVIADGAHNEDAAKKLAESLRFYFTNHKIIYIIGMLRDKEYDKVIRATFSLASHIITVTPPVGERALSAIDLARTAGEYHDAVTAADSVQEAVEIAYLLAGKDKDAVIVAFGSLSYLGELMDTVEHRDTIRRDTHGRSDQD